RVSLTWLFPAPSTRGSIHPQLDSGDSPMAPSWYPRAQHPHAVPSFARWLSAALVLFVTAVPAEAGAQPPRARGAAQPAAQPPAATRAATAPMSSTARRDSADAE